jgi:iron(III) transport system ATP-binding protein
MGLSTDPAYLAVRSAPSMSPPWLRKLKWFRNVRAEASPPALPEVVPARGRAAVAIAASLTFEGVERRYGAARALKGVSLEIAPGEVVCLLGPSGCGKTTLLRIASGIEKPSRGRVLINGQEVAGPTRFVPPEQRNVGLMFQDFALFPHLTILDNVAFGLRALPRATAEREALALLARVGLEGFGPQYPSILSGGQAQRVALARAMVPRPSVMLMDEPFSGLDVQLRDHLQEETLALLRETRATCMIVTHNPEEAMRLGDRVAVMQGGRVMQIGRAEDLYRHPADLFVARLFSEINEVRYVIQGGGITTPVGRFSMPEDNNMVDGDEAILCIRQRAIELNTPGKAATQAGALPGRVLRAKFLGDAVQLEVGVQGFDAPLKVRVDEAVAPARGAEVAVAISPTSVLVFPAERPEAA